MIKNDTTFYNCSQEASPEAFQAIEIGGEIFVLIPADKFEIVGKPLNQEVLLLRKTK